MLMALRFEPSRFFLKGKVTQKQTSYKHKHTVREEVSRVWNVRPLTFILHLYYRSYRLVSSLQQLILY